MDKWIWAWSGLTFVVGYASGVLVTWWNNRQTRPYIYKDPNVTPLDKTRAMHALINKWYITDYTENGHTRIMTTAPDGTFTIATVRDTAIAIAIVERHNGRLHRLQNRLK